MSSSSAMQHAPLNLFNQFQYILDSICVVLNLNIRAKSNFFNIGIINKYPMMTCYGHFDFTMICPHECLSLYMGEVAVRTTGFFTRTMFLSRASCTDYYPEIFCK